MMRNSSLSQIRWIAKPWEYVDLCEGVFFISPDASMWIVGSKRLQTPFYPTQIEVV